MSDDMRRERLVAAVHAAEAGKAKAVANGPRSFWSKRLAAAKKALATYDKRRWRVVPEGPE